MYRPNVLDYISDMRTLKKYSPRSVNNHLSALLCYNEFLIQSGIQTEMMVLHADFMKVQLQYASPSTVDKKDVEAFRQKLLEKGNKRNYAIVTLYAYTGLRRSECVGLRLENGYTIHEVANQAGHSNVQTTLIYSNPTAKEMKEKANKL